MTTVNHEEEVIWQGPTAWGVLPIRHLANKIAFALSEGPLDAPEFSQAIARFSELNHAERVWVWTFLVDRVDQKGDDFMDRVTLAHVGVGGLVLESGRQALVIDERGHSVSVRNNWQGPATGEAPMPSREWL